MIPAPARGDSAGTRWTTVDATKKLDYTTPTENKKAFLPVVCGSSYTPPKKARSRTTTALEMYT